MVDWIYCSCGKVIDEFEEFCHWCGKRREEIDEQLSEGKNEDVSRKSI
jgi:hypothetical protein